MNVLHYLEFKAMGLTQDEIKSAVQLGVTPDEIKVAKAIKTTADDVVDNAEPAPEPAKATEPAPEAGTDYKALYEAEKAKVSKLQEENTKTPVPEDIITADSIVKDIAARL